ncbi:hypothetical protein FHS21_005798 [Phyllobacterium trifolii]|uniref:Uncharacterized protein n=1 Tax=Phyllobacterium trifolii TaxID=300193 RepID=A0A839UHD0_9HYPH|nr:hypothetical protein [Phyllobacterium trifolii]
MAIADNTDELIDLPGYHLISMFVAIGKPIADAWPRGGQLPIEEVLVRGSFQRKAVGLLHLRSTRLGKGSSEHLGHQVVSLGST